MPKIEDLETVFLTIALFAPGFLIMYGRSQFQTGRMKDVGQNLFEYLTVASIYYAFSFPIFIQLNDPNYLVYLVFLCLLPITIGISIGIATQKKIFRKFCKLLGLNPVHSAPTAWDHVFMGRKGASWVVVTLKSDRKYYGVFGENSLASSNLNRRDIFLENITNSNFVPIESDGRNRGVWISEEEIASIEIIED